MKAPSLYKEQHGLSFLKLHLNYIDTRFLEPCSLDRQNQSRDVWSWCTAPWQKLSTAYQHKHLMPAVRDTSVWVAIWVCFAIAVTESTMCTYVYQSVLKSNVKLSIRLLEVVWKWVMQQNSDLKHTQQIYNRMAEKKNQGVAITQSKSIPQTNWNAVSVWECIPKSSQHCTEEWPKIPSQWCKRQIKSYRKQCLVLLLKMGCTFFLQFYSGLDVL